MSKKTAIKLSIYFVGFIMPILAMINCEGFHEGSMKVKSCFIDSDIIRSYADFYYGWLAISSFMLFIPVIIYIGVVVLLAKFSARVL